MSSAGRGEPEDYATIYSAAMYALFSATERFIRSTRKTSTTATTAKTRTQSLTALVESFCSAEVISFSAQFALRCRRSRALLAWTWFRLGKFLSRA
jgi:hypothetical protein